MDFVFLVTSGVCILAICIALICLIVVLRTRFTRGGTTEPYAMLLPEFRPGASEDRDARSSDP